MAAIITAHIAHNSATCGASHTPAIIQADGPDIDPYISRAMATTHAQQIAGMTMRTKTRLARGLASAASTAVGFDGIRAYCVRD